MIGTNPQSKLVHSVFEPLPWQIAPWRDKSPVLLLTGSAGGGKSRFAAEKVNGFLLKYSKATGLALRKAREFATKSVVPMMIRVSSGETELVEVADGKIERTVQYDSRAPDDSDYKKSELAFHYRNGSLLYIGGMKDNDQREALRSIGQDGSIDIAWMEEATAFKFEDFQELRPRMRGKAASWRQIILSTNPDSPNHWINQKLILGRLASVYYSGAPDNLHNPADYLDSLNSLEGVQFERLVRGLWVQAEGVIFDNFDPRPGYNVDEAADYIPGRPVIWGIDDGYVQGSGPGNANYHPRVCLFGQVTPTGGLNIFNEYYRTGEPSYDATIDDLLRQDDYPYTPPDAAYVDSSAQMFIGALWARDLFAMGGTHKVSEGIKNVRRLISDENGVRLLKIHPRCVHLIREMASYIYDSNSKVTHVGEPKPLAVDDHGPSALRYMAHPLRNVTEA